MAHGIHRSFGRAFTLLAFTFAGVWGCGTDAGRPGQVTEQPTEPLSHGQILSILSTVDQGEIKGAEIARTRSTDGAVRGYAERLGEEHKAAETKIKELQDTLRVKQETSELQANLRRQGERTAELLRTTPAAEFDVTYLDAQIGMHQRAITLIERKLLPDAESEEMENLLGDIRATMLKHLTQARMLRKRFPTPPGGGL